MLSISQSLLAIIDQFQKLWGRAHPIKEYPLQAQMIKIILKAQSKMKIDLYLIEPIPAE
ncbi:MAG TPA: hypothetical protein GXX65_04500 [Methanosarcina sp.]|jgi:hypothetical protein|nr:hypothetical protein [Methanosarcina sp.]MDD4522073.1 hypothetical protein [Methanosarcina sp.]HHV23807.1 hypothetical protein [Methanosarcina sp.]